jgi:two-component system response regulator NreC
MDNISIGIFDKQVITLEGIKSLLDKADGLQVLFTVHDGKQLFLSMKEKKVNILIINIHGLGVKELNLISYTNTYHPKVKVLIMSVDNQEENVLKTIKAGAQGYLSSETSKEELVEAIYTLRNGHDYFSKSITHLLLNNYIKKIKTGENPAKNNLDALSNRELEIVRLWGDSLTNKEIADKLFISVRTVESHKNHIMQKLNLKTSVDLVKFAIKNNIIEI